MPRKKVWENLADLGLSILDEKNQKIKKKKSGYKKKKILSKNNQTEDNVKKILALSSQKLDLCTTQKIIARATEKHHIRLEDFKEQKTAFTEEDFEKFEQEYTGD